MTRKGRQGGQAANGQLGCLPACQLGCATAATWQFDSLVAAWLLDQQTQTAEETRSQTADCIRRIYVCVYVNCIYIYIHIYICDMYVNLKI